MGSTFKLVERPRFPKKIKNWRNPCGFSFFFNILLLVYIKSSNSSRETQDMKRIQAEK